MYKKINQGKNKEFKPKRIILAGVTHEVNSVDELHKIRKELDEQKKIKIEQEEEEKKKQVLIKRIHAKNMDVKTIKIISDIGDNTNKNKNIIKQPVKKPLVIPEKPKLVIKPSSSFKKPAKQNSAPVIDQNSVPIVNPMPIVKQNVVEIPMKKEIIKKEVIKNDEDKPLSLKTHEHKPIQKLKNKSIAEKFENKVETVETVVTKIDDGIDPDHENDNNENDNSSGDNSITKLENVDGFFWKQFDVVKTNWYVLVLKSNEGEQGLIKILEDKTQIYPLLRINNDMFKYRTQNGIDEYRIYFKTTKTSVKVDMYIIGLTVKEIKLQQITVDVCIKSIDLWKLRKLYDLELIKYYITNTKFDYSEKFFDRFNADYELFKNPDYFDKYMKTLKLDTKSIVPENNNKINVLYLMYSTTEYECYGYTVRSHYLIKNGNNDKYKIHGVTRYGYPYDRENGYYKEQPSEEKEYDGVMYLKLLNGTDNFNNCNILDYLKRYINIVIKLAVKKNAKIIHATTNYWNGIAAICAAQYLGIKAIYELRGLWDEGVLTHKPEVRNSDMLKLMKTQEMKIYGHVDKIVTINNQIKNKLVSDHGVPENKIMVIDNCVDTGLFKPNELLRKSLCLRHNIDENSMIIGYIGTLSNYEGIEYILKVLVNLDNVKFVMIGDGLYKSELDKMVKSLGVSDKVISLGKMKHNDVIEYYNLFDIVTYPRKNCDLCNNTTSYKIFEAMSMSKAIIVSDLNAYNDIINDNENGLICIPDDVNDLSKKIKMLIDDVDLRKRLGENARQWVIKNRECENIGGKLRDIYDGFI